MTQQSKIIKDMLEALDLEKTGFVTAQLTEEIYNRVAMTPHQQQVAQKRWVTAAIKRRTSKMLVAGVPVFILVDQQRGVYVHIAKASADEIEADGRAYMAQGKTLQAIGKAMVKLATRRRAGQA